MIMTYKDFEHSLQYKVKNGKQYWWCRFSKTLKCSGHVHFLNGKVVKFIPHNHESHVGKMKVSTMGTSDMTVRYSKSIRKTLVLHYQGYEYTKMRNTTDGRVRWHCRWQSRLKCHGCVYTKNGNIDGHAREHNHLPPNIAPVVKPSENTMVSPMFLC